jgi:catechol 2,3-dioxygenase-like lactoylglutathione lyase family enzyme
MKVIGIDHLVINVSDAEKAMCWYRDRLGMEPLRYEEWKSGTAPFLSMKINETTIIDLLETERSGENVDHIALYVEGDLETLLDHDDVETVREFKSIYGAQGWGPAVYIRDLDGNQIELKLYENLI